MPLTLSEINRAVRSDPGAYVSACCTQLAQQISDAAELVCHRRSRSPIVLLSGPTGSGKTTSAGMIAHALERQGIGAHVVSLDDYFLDVTPELTPRDTQGNYDFESPLCLDLELLQKHFDLLSRGQAIQVPAFDFVAQARRRDYAEELRPKADEVVIFEGIHALGQEVGGRHPEATRIFVNVCSDIMEEKQVCFWASRLRLARRIIRDHRSRGASPAYTLELWDNVRSNEKRTLLAQQDSADVVVDTTLGYEPGVLRVVAMPLLQEVSPETKRYEQVQNMIEQFALFEPVAPGLVPQDALTREFIGGGIWG